VIASRLIWYSETAVTPVVASVIAIPAKMNRAGFARSERAIRIMVFVIASASGLLSDQPSYV
jgi:hypothetical protein